MNTSMCSVMNAEASTPATVGRCSGSLLSSRPTSARRPALYSSGTGAYSPCTILKTMPRRLLALNACLSVHISYRMQPMAHTSLL